MSDPIVGKTLGTDGMVETVTIRLPAPGARAGCPPLRITIRDAPEPGGRGVVASCRAITTTLPTAPDDDRSDADLVLLAACVHELQCGRCDPTEVVWATGMEGR